MFLFLHPSDEKQTLQIFKHSVNQIINILFICSLFLFFPMLFILLYSFALLYCYSILFSFILILFFYILLFCFTLSYFLKLIPMLFYHIQFYSFNLLFCFISFSFSYYSLYLVIQFNSILLIFIIPILLVGNSILFSFRFYIILIF